MKTCALVLSLLVLCLPASAQWIVDGQNGIFTLNGRVGIGTNAPASKVEVNVANNGDGITIGGAQSAGLTLFATPVLTTDRNWGIFPNYATHGDLTFLRSASSTALPYGGTVAMAIQASGNVGIGLGPNPGLHRLHVGVTNNGDGIAVSGAQSPGLRLITAPSDPADRSWGIFPNHTTHGDLVISRSPDSTSTTYPGQIAVSIQSNGNMHVNGNVTSSGTIAAQYQDVAEWVPTRESGLRAGTVVVVRTGTVNEVVASTTAYDTRVAGVVSAQPGVLLGVADPSRIPVATVGRVKVMVEGPVEAGDLLVSSSTPGTAMRSVPIDVAGMKIHRPGTIIGKALEPHAGGRGEILVLLSMQ